MSCTPRALYSLRGYDAEIGYTWLIADGLAMGALLAIFLRSPWGSRPRLKQLAIGSLTISLATFAAGTPLGIFLVGRWPGFTFRETILDLFFFGLISSALLIGTSRWKAIVNRPALQFLGEISYGVYLINRLVRGVLDGVLSRWAPNLYAAQGNFGHMLLLFFVAASATGVLAWLWRWYFEEPFLRLKERFEDRPVDKKSRSASHSFVTNIEPEPGKN